MRSALNSYYVITYFTIKKTIGVLGILFPILMAFGGLLGGSRELQGTISNYYYTNMRDMFSGILYVVGLFLICEKGYDTVDEIASNIAGAAALGIAFFPMSLGHPVPQPIGVLALDERLSDIIHLASAATFFLSSSFISLFLFTKSGADRTNPGKLRRNRIFVICGIVMLSSITLTHVYNLFLKTPEWDRYRPVFFLESVALVAFGFSWLVKGERRMFRRDSSRNARLGLKKFGEDIHPTVRNMP